MFPYRFQHISVAGSVNSGISKMYRNVIMKVIFNFSVMGSKVRQNCSRAFIFEDIQLQLSRPNNISNNPQQLPIDPSIHPFIIGKIKIGVYKKFIII